ncbi:hypothetical protein Tco_0628765 [Tanacetum coccineum]|uniref:MAK10-like protein n=1 Tax=Tanacetum coccineum TaxID=301880 RepID=A0ABQ4WRE6_9ASTR
MEDHLYILLKSQRNGGKFLHIYTARNTVSRLVELNSSDDQVRFVTYRAFLVSFHLKCKIDLAAGGKLHNKNAHESWEIIENLSLYDHEGWNETKKFVKSVKAIYTPQGISKHLNEDFLSLKTRLTSYKMDRDQPLGA